MKTVYLSLGSNLGDREANLTRAHEMLEGPRLRMQRLSSIYETEPVDVRDQPWFLNQVAEVETDLFPLMLLNHAGRVEHLMGRERRIAKGPRNMDVDILLYGRFVINSPRLVIPHPRMTERRFVLEPLAELAAEFRHPVLKRTVKELLAELKGQVVRKR